MNAKDIILAVIMAIAILGFALIDLQRYLPDSVEIEYKYDALKSGTWGK